jgi:dethiobiotin synthetase
MPRPPTVLITGTDTGVGKPWVACARAGALRRAGRAVAAVKPVETGYADEAAPMEDGARLAGATGQREPTRALRRFRAPVAPALAAELEGGAIDLDDLAAEIEALTGHADLLLLEGTGGLLVPFGWDWTVVDLAQAFEATALVVASDRLDGINHTLLTLGALDFAGLRVAGVLLNTPPRPDATTGSNAAAIARLSGIDRVRSIPRVHEPNEASPWLAEVSGWL